MNRDTLETQWVEVRQIIRDKFGNLTEDDIRQINGHYDQLVLKLQQKYGYTKEEAEDRIRSWNFDRASVRPTPFKDTVARNDKVRKEEDNSNVLKWVLGLGIPLLLLGLWFLNAERSDRAYERTVTQEQIVETPADRNLVTNLRAAFARQPTLAQELQGLTIASHNGEVTLTGQVSNRTIRDQIVNAVRNFPGVSSVNNNIEIR